jgi:chromosome segregation ATPase
MGVIAPEDYSELYEKSCRLERELAKVRSLFESSKVARKSLRDACDSLQAEIREVTQERDEAREKLAQSQEYIARGRSWNSPDSLLAEIDRIKRERDEVMSALREIKDKYGISDRHVMREKNAEIAELRATLNMRYDADQRAIRRWQAAHPGNELTWPDHADMVVWMLERCDTLADALQNLCDRFTGKEKSRDITEQLKKAYEALAAVKGEA